MGGVPVWLASYSLRNKKGMLVTTDLFDAVQRRRARDVLLQALAGVGDVNRFRLFRMQVTTCLHRALTDEERDAICACPLGRPRYIAGLPVEIIEERGVPDIPSTRPCLTPSRRPLDPKNARAWLPVGCGTCEPCRARAEIEDPAHA